jgi:hypothetical protein
LFSNHWFRRKGHLKLFSFFEFFTRRDILTLKYMSHYAHFHGEKHLHDNIISLLKRGGGGLGPYNECNVATVYWIATFKYFYNYLLFQNALFTDINNLAKYFRIFELLYTNHDVIFGGFLGFLCQFLGFAQDIFLWESTNQTDPN